MNWKDELIDNENQVEDFLRRHLHMHEIPQPLEFGLDLKGQNISFTALPLLSFHGHSTKHGELSFEGCDATQGHHFGSMALKCMLGIAAGRGCDYIFVDMVRHDGLSFWPYHGALPYSATGIGHGDFDYFIRDHDDQLGSDAREKIANIQAIAKQSELWAWRELSQCDARLNDGRFVRNVMFGRMVPDDHQVILMGEKGTREILEKRLGVIPPFRPFSGDSLYDFSHMIGELSVRPKEAAHFAL